VRSNVSLLRRQRGFTLLEALLSVGLVSIVVGISLPVYQGFQSRTDLEIATQSVARANYEDSQWGIEVIPGTGAVLFKGNSYATRDTVFDQPISVPSTIALTIGGAMSPGNETVFARITGTPSNTGTVTLTFTRGNDVRTVTLNAAGTVSY
jgi:type II secretory pathway pseudopilin PulG